MFVLLPVTITQLICYAEAAEILRLELGRKAPKLARLMAMEITNRRAKTIAEEFLEFNGYPNLRRCGGKQITSPRETGKPTKRRISSVGRQLARSTLPRSAFPSDPSRN